MKVGVFSDVHGNLEALNACLERLDKEQAERFIFCGDLIGYGPDPEACVQKILKLPLLACVLGNHDAALHQPELEAFFKSINRRLYMLNCYEKSDAVAPEELDSLPTLTKQSVKQITVKRYSTTHDNRIGLEGIIGECRMENVSERNLELLYAGELVHVGKNTSFGFGRYAVKEVVE